uniref:Lysozyme n=1 Tax=Panagrolaimus sp. ES5 TaxID=591445 RepID=A0AC34FSE6_9BILA
MFRHFLLSILLLGYSFEIAEMAMGFDASVAVTRAQFLKFKASGNTFFIARVHRSIGQPDSVGIANIKTAYDDMANVAINAGYKIGIYTGAYAWNTICGSSYTSYSSYPLWWANYNKKADLTTGWKNFGGWTKATIHQYDQNHSENGLIFDPNVK